MQLFYVFLNSIYCKKKFCYEQLVDKILMLNQMLSDIYRKKNADDIVALQIQSTIIVLKYSCQ